MLQFRLRGFPFSTDLPVPLSPRFLPRPWPTRLLLVLVFGLHFLLGAALGLSIDEAHYLLYALHPALSYFDHPPLVGWVQWPLVALDLPTAFLRLVPGVFWLATVVVVYHLAARLQGMSAPQRSTEYCQYAGFWAVLALALAPLLHLLGIGLLPDTLLMFFGVLLMRQTLILMDPATVLRPMPWLVLGVLAGLAGLSKYTAILAAVAVGVCLVVAHGGRVLRSPRLWMAVAVALVLVLPVAVWNLQNNGISFAYQAQHGAGNAWQFAHVLRFLLLQMLAYGPLLWWAWSGWQQAAGKNARSLIAFFAVAFAVLAFMAGGGTSLPHWTAPAWVALAPFAGMGLARAWRQGQHHLVAWVVALQALSCAALLALMFSAGLPFLRDSGTALALNPNPNPFADLHGWDAAGQQARTLAEQHHLDSVAVQHWTLASRLGWYARPMQVHVLEDRVDQFTLWAGHLPAGGNALLVDWSLMAFELPLGATGFANCTLLDTYPVVRWGAPISSFRFYACNGWGGGATPQARHMPTP